MDQLGLERVDYLLHALQLKTVGHQPAEASAQLQSAQTQVLVALLEGTGKTYTMVSIEGNVHANAQTVYLLELEHGGMKFPVAAAPHLFRNIPNIKGRSIAST